MCSFIVPTRVSHARDRYPLRWVTRSGLRSPYSAPILDDTSASMIPSTSTLRASRRKSTSPSIPPLCNSSSRSILSLTTVVLLFSSFLLCPLRMTRWSLFLQTLSLLHHFLGLYCWRRTVSKKRPSPCPRTPPVPADERPGEGRGSYQSKVLDSVQLGGPTWMVGSTIFEMWLGALCNAQVTRGLHNGGRGCPRDGR